MAALADVARTVRGRAIAIREEAAGRRQGRHPGAVHRALAIAEGGWRPGPAVGGRFERAGIRRTPFHNWIGSGVDGQVPLLEGLPPMNEDAADGHQLYVPWWLYKEQLAGKLGFARGYHIEFGGGKRMPGFGTAAGLEWLTGGSYGAKFKEDVRRYYGSFVGFDGRGEMIPNEQSYCEIDPAAKDRFGIPVLRFHWQWSQHELRQAAHMQRTFADIIGAMGGRVHGEVIADGAKAIAPGGSIIHEVGGAIMGADRARSVTNRWSAGLGRRQPGHRRRRRVRVECRQEPDADDHGARVARGGPYPRAHAPQGGVMDRRTSIRWMLAASAALPALGRQSARAASMAASSMTASSGYGTDPRLTAGAHPGAYWPLQLTPSQRLLAGTLADLIIPADAVSPSASTVGIVDFIDEWVSAPYPDQRADRSVVLDGLAWLDAEAGRRHGQPFVRLAGREQGGICDAICSEARAVDALRDQARFFARFRDLVAGGFYSSPAGART